MSYSVITTDNFDREAKRLAKKYKSLKTDLMELFEELAINPQIGTHLGNNIYKIRLAIESKGKGKRGGARIISIVQAIDTNVFLFSIYNKGDKDTISDKEIQELLQNEGLL